MSELIEEYGGVFMSCFFVLLLVPMYLKLLQVITGG